MAAFAASQGRLTIDVRAFVARNAHQNGNIDCEILLGDQLEWNVHERFCVDVADEIVDGGPEEAISAIFIPDNALVRVQQLLEALRLQTLQHRLLVHRVARQQPNKILRGVMVHRVRREHRAGDENRT